MTRNEMIALYRTMTNHETNFIRDPAVTDLLNRAAMNFQRKVKILETSITQDVNAGQAAYNVPGDFIKPLRVEFLRTGVRREILYPTNQETLDIEDLNWREETGDPRKYFMDAGNTQIFLFPEPDATLADGLRLEYTQKPNALASGSDVSILPEQYHEVIVYLAASFGYTRDGELTDAKYFKSLFDQETGIAVAEMARRNPSLRTRKRGHVVQRTRTPLNLGPDYPSYT